MFVLINIKPKENIVGIFDTTDEVFDKVSLYQVVKEIKASRIVVRGLTLTSTNNSNYLEDYDIYVDDIEAKESLAKFYVLDKKMSVEDARKKVGL